MNGPSRRISAAAAKEAKMKKVAIVGGVLLLGLIGFQAPKVLKSLHGSSGTTETAAAPVEPATPPASLTDAVPPSAGAGQLVSFSLFKAKDPFVQQIAADTNPTGGPVPGYKRPGSTNPVVTPTSTTTPTATTEPLPPTTTATTTATDTVPEATPSTTPDTTGTSTTTTTTSTSEEPAATGATIATNGACEAVPVDGTFPKATPYFRLVSVAADGQSIQIGIADGSLDGGMATVTVTKGKTLTLLNKTTQVRYVLELLDACPVTTTDTTATDTTPTTAETTTTTTSTTP